MPVATAKFLELREITRNPLSDNSVVMQKQLREVEAWQGTIGTMIAEAVSYLAISEEMAAIRFVDESETSADRKRRVASETEKEQRLVALLQVQIDAIKNRLMLGQNLNNNREKYHNAT